MGLHISNPWSNQSNLWSSQSNQWPNQSNQWSNIHKYKYSNPPKSNCHVEVFCPQGKQRDAGGAGGAGGVGGAAVLSIFYVLINHPLSAVQCTERDKETEVGTYRGDRLVLRSGNISVVPIVNYSHCT